MGLEPYNVACLLPNGVSCLRQAGDEAVVALQYVLPAPKPRHVSRAPLFDCAGWHMGPLGQTHIPWCSADEVCSVSVRFAAEKCWRTCDTEAHRAAFWSSPASIAHSCPRTARCLVPYAQPGASTGDQACRWCARAVLQHMRFPSSRKHVQPASRSIRCNYVQHMYLIFPW